MITIITGPQGSGKTFLARCIANTLYADRVYAEDKASLKNLIYAEIKRLTIYNCLTIDDIKEYNNLFNYISIIQDTYIKGSVNAILVTQLTINHIPGTQLITIRQ